RRSPDGTITCSEAPAPAIPERTCQQGALFPPGQRGPGPPDVISRALDLAQNRQAAADEQLDIRSYLVRHQIHERIAAVEQIARVIHFIAHQVDERRGERAGK